MPFVDRLHLHQHRALFLAYATRHRPQKADVRESPRLLFEDGEGALVQLGMDLSQLHIAA